MKLGIILSHDNSPVLPALRSLVKSLPEIPTEIYCLCANDGEAERVKEEIQKINDKKNLFSSRILTYQDFNSAQGLANHHFLNDAKADYLLFLSSDVLIDGEALKHMLDHFHPESQVAGVNPLLLADWLPYHEKRIAFMGLVFDFQKKLHYLYEGILADNDLVKKERFFQIAHPACLLIRKGDFQKAGGFREDLGVLSFPGLCLQILKFRSSGYVCVPVSEGRLKYKFDSLSFCGAWNSILQRGRLDTSRIIPDYINICHDDRIEYTCDSWLNEGPAQIPDLSDNHSVKCLQEWRYHPKPTTLLSFLSSLPQEEQLYGLDLVRNRSASLPQTLQYYRVQADIIKSRAQESDFPIITEVDRFQKKIRRFHYGELKPGIELLKKAGIYNCSLDICPAIFDAWVEVTENFEKLEISDNWPEIAVIMPVWNPNPDFLGQAIESVVNQTYPNWQLCIADDASTKKEIRPLLESYAQRYENIRVKFRENNGHICRASNTALELATAPYTAFLDHDDLLSPNALGEVASLIAQKPDLGFIYSDDDRINEYNVRRSPVFRPGFDCDLFYTGHLSTYSTSLIREVGGLRIGTEGSQDQDLRLRVTELLDNDRIAHIPRILYHWRVHEESTASSLLAKPYVLESGRRIYLDAAARKGRKAQWPAMAQHKMPRLLYFPKRRCLCSVILLLDDKEPSRSLLESLGRLEKYVDVEIHAQPLQSASPRLKSFPTLPYVGRGISHTCNEAALRVNGDVLLFLSTDLEPAQDCRLEQLVEQAMMPHIAMAGANIWFDKKLMNGGWYPNADGSVFPLLQGMDRHEMMKSAWGQMCMSRHVLGSPWQCMAVKREACKDDKFLDECYGSFSTVEFGLRAMKKNKFVAMNPWVNWRTKKIPTPPNEAERKFLLEQRGAEIASCTLRNPNLCAAPDKDWTIIL